MSKFKPEKQLKDALSQSSILISSLLSNPKVDHKKMFYYLKSPQKYLSPAKVEPNKHLSPIQINNQKTSLLKSISDFSDEDFNLSEQLFKLNL